MLQDPEPDVWHGRVDQEDSEQSRRWHQHIVFEKDHVESLKEDLHHAPAIIGFACDEGVKRNQGRVGASHGPEAIRRSLANLACAKNFTLYELGNITCDGELEASQRDLAQVVEKVLEKKGFPLILGGGHEVAWGSYLGAQQYLLAQRRKAKLGIINFDAHFDLRNPEPMSSSGTPFRQCCEFCHTQELPFDYFVLGLNPSVNTEVLFDYAARHGVKWVTDTALCESHWQEIDKHLENFIKKLDFLYLTICLDVFSSCYAPGVSAPAALGISPFIGIQLLKKIKQLCAYHQVPLLLCDIAEMNPQYDRDGQTARLAARLIYEVVN